MEPEDDAFRNKVVLLIIRFIDKILEMSGRTRKSKLTTTHLHLVNDISTQQHQSAKPKIMPKILYKQIKQCIENSYGKIIQNFTIIKPTNAFRLVVDII